MPRRLLIIQLGDIGDLVLSTPALAALRERFPDAHIAVLTSAQAAAVLYHTNLADEVIVFERRALDSPRKLLDPRELRRAAALAGRLRRGAFDTTVFFHHFSTGAGALKMAALAYAAASPHVVGLDNGRGFFLTHRLTDEGFGARHQAQYWLDLVGLLGAASAPRSSQVGVSAADAAWAARIFQDANRQTQQTLDQNPGTVGGLSGRSHGAWAAIHAGSGGDSAARRWSPEGFAQVADRLADDGAQIVLVGGANDDNARVKALMRHTPLDLTGQTTLNQLAALLARCTVYIGADSGVMHVACAAGVPVAAIFGPSNPAAWGPWTPEGRSIIVRSAPLCSPCSYVGHEIGQRAGCAARTCMRMVTPDQVAAAAQALMTPAEADISRPEREQNPGVVGSSSALPAIDILGIPVSVITYDAWLDQIDAWVKDGGRTRQVCTINPEFLMIARRDPIFRYILRRADLTVPDGVGLLWAARRRGTPLPERVTGSDGVPKIAERAARVGWRLFLLGAAPGVADKAAAVLRARFPGVAIVGTYGGSPAAAEEDAIVERVNASGADILFVAYGAPEQDKWIARNLPRLRVAMAMGVGGALDFVAGVVPRAPLWMQRIGVEWLYRLYLQPWRIRRMMRLPRFVWAVLREAR